MVSKKLCKPQVFKYVFGFEMRLLIFNLFKFEAVKGLFGHAMLFYLNKSLFHITDSTCPDGCICNGYHYECPGIKLNNTSLENTITPNVREL